VPINAVLAYGLIFGAFGLPQLDLLGAGIATTIVNTAMCAASVAVVMVCEPFKPYRTLARWWRYDPTMMRQLLRVGVPIAAAFMLEFGLFGTAALMMGWISSSALAAHQIALQTAAIAFMVPFGISMAATVRVGHAVGRGDATGARRAGLSALAVGGAFMAVTGVVIVVGRSLIPALFLGAATADAVETVAIANLLLLFAAGFAMTDGVQTIAAGALRGLNDTRMPMLIAAFSFWVVGVGTAYALGFRAHYGAAGIWSGISAGLAVYAVLLTVRFHLLTRDGQRSIPAIAKQ
jgi:multidrug resistance protein, MATE family